MGDCTWRTKRAAWREASHNASTRAGDEPGDVSLDEATSCRGRAARQFFATRSRRNPLKTRFRGLARRLHFRPS